MLTTLIKAGELSSHLKDPNWILLDCRFDLMNPNLGRQTYFAGHIPGARYVHLDEDASGKKIDEAGHFCGRHPLPEYTELLATVRRLGITNTSQVVVYDANGGVFSARVWWLMRWLGHEAVALLDGGMQAWQAAGNQLTALESIYIPSAFYPKPALVSIVTIKDVMDNLLTQERTVVDARSPDRFRGENETLDRVGGHIPGAKNRFFKDNLDESGFFKSPSQLREEFLSILDDPHLGIMQCGSGVTACHNLLALEIANLPGAALYPGSWSQWSADPQNPVAATV